MWKKYQDDYKKEMMYVMKIQIILSIKDQLLMEKM